MTTRNLLSELAADANADFQTPRLRARRNDMTRSDLGYAILRAVKNGIGLSANHGGSVANGYGYPAETECVAVFAVRHDGGKMDLAYDVGRHAANKATRASAVAAVTGQSRGPWWTLAGGRMPAATLAETPIDGIIIRWHRSRLLTRRVYVSYRGQSDICEFAPSDKPIRLARAAVRLLVEHGYDAYIERATANSTQTIHDRVCIGRGDDQYHLSIDWTPRNFSAHVLQAAKIATTAIRIRRTERRLVARNAELDRLIAERKSSIYVEVEDSIVAGNCESRTMMFARQMWERLGASGPAAVRADEILSARNDSYTMRACRVAALRYV